MFNTKVPESIEAKKRKQRISKDQSNSFNTWIHSHPEYKYMSGQKLADRFEAESGVKVSRAYALKIRKMFEKELDEEETEEHHQVVQEEDHKNDTESYDEEEQQLQEEEQQEEVIKEEPKPKPKRFSIKSFSDHLPAPTTRKPKRLLVELQTSDSDNHQIPDDME